MTSTVKLTKAQRELLTYLVDGLELSYDPSNGHVWLRTSGEGWLFRINKATFNAATVRGFIARGVGQTYDITLAGRAALAAQD